MQSYFNTSKHSADIFKRAIRFMANNAINPTPINYAVVYEYCMPEESNEYNKNLKFTREIEDIINSSDGFNDVSGLKLYRKYIREIPENPQDIIDKTHDLPELFSSFIEKASNYLVYHVNLLENKSATEQQEAILDLRTMVKALEHDIKEIKTKHQRISSMVDQGGQKSLRDVFTGLYADKKAIELYEAMKSQGKKDVVILFFSFDGMSAVKKTFGEQVEEAIARHFVKSIANEIPESMEIYRWSADDGYLMMSYHEEALEQLAVKIKAAFNAKKLTHKFTKENITELITLKHATASTGKNLTLLVRSAKQRLRA
jgi:diguanylate cyclase